MVLDYYEKSICVLTILIQNSIWFWARQYMYTAYANYIGPSVMTDANCEGFPICDDRITENDRFVIKIIGIHCVYVTI